MNYAKHYQTLIDRAESRVIVGYSERHHVVPRCLDNSSKHTVRLTPEEHYVAHQLLIKMFPGVNGLVFAAFRMTHGYDATAARSNKLYGWLSRKRAEIYASSEWRAEQSARLSGQKRTEEACKNMRESYTPERREIHRQVRIRLNKAQAGTPAHNKGVPMSDAQKVKCRKPRSVEGRAAIKAAVEAREVHRQQGIGYQLSQEQKEQSSAAKRSAWLNSSSEQKTTRLAGLVAANSSTTSEREARKSASLKLAWAVRKEADALLTTEQKLQRTIDRLEKRVAKLEAQAAQERADSEVA